MNPLIEFDSPRVFVNADGSKVRASTLMRLGDGLAVERLPANTAPGEPSVATLKLASPMYQPAQFSATNNNGQSFADGIGADVEWNIETDQFLQKLRIGHDSESNAEQVIVEDAGLYLVSASVRVENTPGLTSVYLSVYTNTETQTAASAAGAGDALNLALAFPLRCYAGQVVKAVVQPFGADTSIVLDLPHTWFRIVRIG